MSELSMFLRAFIVLSFISLSGWAQPTDKLTGNWRGVLEIQGKQLPFTFEIELKNNQHVAYVRNGAERLMLDEVRVTRDSIEMVMHIFDATFKAAIRNNYLEGVFRINYANDYALPFKAFYGQNYRFAPTVKAANIKDFSGKYSVQFFNPTNTVSAMGIISQHGNYVEGTFLTPTGDYRYLEGNVIGDTLWLSAFDGNHLYLFNAVKAGDTLRGTQWLGRSRNREWMGIKNDQAKPPSTESLTYLNQGHETLLFSFPNTAGQKVSIKDDRFKNKVVVVQLLGTWCPNCMDETKFLSSWYQQNKQRGVEIIGLAYEQKADFNYASSRVLKMKERLDVPYEVLIAGTVDNPSATLPELNRVVGFPTTIFIGRDGKVSYIHTGFSGPATGIFFDQEKEQFNNKINELLAK